MAVGVPPPPLNSPNGSYYWLEWYTNLTNFLNGQNIPWSNLNFTNSNIHDLQHRDHNSLTNVQGGNTIGAYPATGFAYHMLGVGSWDNVNSVAKVPTSWTITGTNPYTVNFNGTASPLFSDFMAGATSNTTGVTVNNVTWATSGNLTSFTISMSAAGSFSFWCSTI